MALLFGVRNRVVEEGVNLVTGVNLDVDKKHHGNHNGKDDGSVKVTGQEGRLQSTGCGVQNNTPRNEKRSKTDINAGEGLHGCCATEQEHGSHDNVGGQAKEEEGNVCRLAPASVDNLTSSVRRGSDFLQIDSDDAKEQHLNSGAGSIPKSGLTRQRSGLVYKGIEGGDELGVCRHR